jgi:hypothetical protein
MSGALIAGAVASAAFGKWLLAALVLVALPSFLPMITLWVVGAAFSGRYLVMSLVFLALAIGAITTGAWVAGIIGVVFAAFQLLMATLVGAGAYSWRVRPESTEHPPPKT